MPRTDSKGDYTLGKLIASRWGIMGDLDNILLL